MKRLLLFWLFSFSAFAFAQTNQYSGIKGKVLTADGKSAEAVTVLMRNTGKAAVTDENGLFEFSKIKEGDYLLVFSLMGFNKKEVKVKVQRGEDTMLSVQLEESYAELQQVIVQAKSGKYAETQPSPSLRLNTPLIEIPQNIQITTRQLLTDQGLVSMSEAIRTVSGIQKNYGGLNDITLNVRGVEVPYNLLRNGIGGYWWNQQEDIAMVEKIEFIKGPAGFIVNSFPPGGFVNMVTKQPVRQPVASIDEQFGSFNLFRLTTDWGGPFSKKSDFSYRFNAGIHKQDRAFQYGNAERYFVCGAIKYDASKKNTLTGEFNFMRGRTLGNNDLVPSRDGKMFSLPRNFAVANAKTDTMIVHDSYFRLQAAHKFNDNWTLNLLLGYVHGIWGQGYRLSADGDHPVTNDTLYRNVYWDDWRNFSKVAQVYLNGSFYTGKKVEHRILGALDFNDLGYNDPWINVEGKSFGLYIPSPNYYVNPALLTNITDQDVDKIDFKNYSAYLEDLIKINEKFIVTMAGRFMHEDVKLGGSWVPVYQQRTSYNVFTPRVALSWLFSDDFSIYSLYDQFFIPEFERNYQHKPFDPLTGSNAEAGVKKYFFSKKLNTSLSIYRIIANNALSSDPLHPDNFIQTAQYVHKGVEADIAGNITPALMVSANYAFTDARVSEGDSNQLGKKKLGTPDHSGNLWMKYRLLNGKFKGFSFSLGYQYMGRRSALYMNDPGKNVYLPVYNLFDAAISYQQEKFNVGLNVYNLTNIQYAREGYFNTANNEWRYTPGEPINFRLSVGVNLVSLKKK